MIAQDIAFGGEVTREGQTVEIQFDEFLPSLSPPIQEKVKKMAEVLRDEYQKLTATFGSIPIKVIFVPANQPLKKARRKIRDVLQVGLDKKGAFLQAYMGYWDLSCDDSKEIILYISTQAPENAKNIIWIAGITQKIIENHFQLVVKTADHQILQELAKRVKTNEGLKEVFYILLIESLSILILSFILPERKFKNLLDSLDTLEIQRRTFYHKVKKCPFWKTILIPEMAMWHSLALCFALKKKKKKIESAIPEDLKEIFSKFVKVFLEVKEEFLRRIDKVKLNVLEEEIKVPEIPIEERKRIFLGKYQIPEIFKERIKEIEKEHLFDRVLKILSFFNLL